MIKFIVALLFMCSLSSWSMTSTGRHAWKVTNTYGKVQLLTGYQAFYNELSQKEASTYEEWKLRETTMWQFFINEAWATEGMNCIYAGWPSKRVSNLCSSPGRQNPDYDNGSCSSNQMHCQPMMFGKGLCVPTGTPQQRSLAFSNCTKKFAASKRTMEDVVNEVKADNKEAQLLELMDFADKICTEGKQASTPMCTRLKATVEKLRHFDVRPKVETKPEETKPIVEMKKEESKPEETTPDIVKTEPIVVIDGEKVTDEQKKKDLIESVELVNKGIVQVKEEVAVIDCPPETNGKPFDREEPRPINLEYTTTRPGSNRSWDMTYKKDMNEAELRPTGFVLTNVGPNKIAGTPLDPEEKVMREWRFVSDDNSKQESYLWVTDDAGSGKLSQLMESVVMLIPRKMKPDVSMVNGDVHVTLATGEKVVFDKDTKEVKAGVIKERAVDLNPDRFNRKPAPLDYNGTGISIRVDRRGEDPRLMKGNAVITQNGKKCEVPAGQLWNGDTSFRYKNDNDLLNYLNRKCGNKFNI
ncbi:hypothetical protein ACJVC5_02405 [Peredibacter sp. HCB2-198]|uniref:hypothetical protein n=1 Tax=Peredibacter sp. HCB2-198 TaxID=3383025 RepID=UPI0038B4DE28